MALARLDTRQITDWTSFHLLCKKELGFPDFYGMNMDAWIDCLSYLDKGEGMSRFVLDPGEMLHIEITNTEDFNSRVPEIFDTLVECTAFVNCRYIEWDKQPLISLVFTDNR